MRTGNWELGERSERSETTRPAPDLGTGPEVMGWMLHAAEEAGRGDPSLVTGKRVILGVEPSTPRLTETHERTEVLERLDVVWGTISHRQAGEWRTHALTTAISRVLDAMRAGGMPLAANGRS